MAFEFRSSSDHHYFIRSFQNIEFHTRRPSIAKQSQKAEGTPACSGVWLDYAALKRPGVRKLHVLRVLVSRKPTRVIVRVRNYEHFQFVLRVPT